MQHNIRGPLATSSPISLRRRGLTWVALVIVLMTGSQDLLAQQGPLFTERFANAFDPNSRTYFSVQGTEGKQFGGQQPYASVGATQYVDSIDDAINFNGTTTIQNANNGGN